MKAKIICILIITLLIVTSQVFSTVAMLGDTGSMEISSSSIINNSYYIGNNIRPIVWDNGMNYNVSLGLLDCQWDEINQFDAYSADDFRFNESKEVCDVHWIGGYWGGNYQNGAFDWCISFMYDDGSGKAPDSHPKTPSYVGPLCYTWDEITKTLIEDTGFAIYYELSVNLSENIIFPAFEKFWISIWGVGVYLPQCGLGHHKSPIKLSDAVFRSISYGYQDWENGSIVIGYPFDLCFQLTTKNQPPDAPTITGEIEGNVNTEYDYTFNAVDPNSHMVKYHIDWGDTTSEVTDLSASGVNVIVPHTFTTEGTFIITAYAEDEFGLTGPLNTLEVTMKKSKALPTTLIQIILERYLLLSRLFQRLGI